MKHPWHSRVLTGLLAFVLTAVGVPVPPFLSAQPVFGASPANLAASSSSTFEIKRVSIASDGTQGNDDSAVYGNNVSGNGRYVAFGSLASDLVPDDTNNAADIFVYDLWSEKIERVSVASDGTQGNDVSINSVAISKDGRYVAFHSRATNLLPGDTNGQDDVFIRDRQAGITQRVSVASDGTQGDNFSGFSYVYLSDDGRFVAYDSPATNLVPNDTNAQDDVFVFDRQTNQNRRVSVASDGTQGNNYSIIDDLSSDGRWVLFESTATNLVTGDTNNAADVFLYDMQTAQTTRVSLGNAGLQGNGGSGSGGLSDDGRFIGFVSAATNLVTGDTNAANDAFVFDRQTNTTTRVSVTSSGSQSTGGSFMGVTLSPDGRFVVFASTASNLVAGDTNGVWDVFVRDRTQGTTTLVSLPAEGGQSNGRSGAMRKPTISDDGKIVAFDSAATNLVAGDTNAKYDVFIYHTLPAWTVMFYLDGDQNGTNRVKSLDPSYLNVFNQLEASANNSDVNVVALWDRQGNNNTAYYKVDYDTNMDQLASYSEGANRWSKGELNMGNPASLSDFVQWARTKYRAQHYALFISDHGTGLGGTAIDQTSAGDLIEVKELSSALSAATSNGTQKLDILFADSCLMAMIETEYQIRSYASTYIASENTIWIPTGGSGPYANYLNSITASTTPQQLTASILAEYGGWLNGTFPDRFGYTLSAVDLTQTDALITQISNLSAALKLHLAANRSQIQAARNAAQRFDSNSNNFIVSSDEYVDLADLASELKQRISDPDVQTASQGVLDALNMYVIGNTSKAGKEIYPSSALDPNRVHGVSIFFPTGDAKRSFYTVQNLDFASDAIWNPQPGPSPAQAASAAPGWGSFLVEYVPTSAPDDPTPPQVAAPLPVTLTDIEVQIGAESKGSYLLDTNESTRQSYAALNSGPVKIVNLSNKPMMAAERVIYKANGVNTSFTEMMALPDNELDTTYWLPWYNNVDLDTQLRFGNVSNSPATLNIYIGNTLMTLTAIVLQPGESLRKSFPGINNGPVQIVSDVNLVAAERLIYQADGTNTSFSEMMALPDSQLNTSYWLPWYNNLDLDTQLRFGNVSNNPTEVHVYIGGAEMPGSPFSLGVGESKRISFAGVNRGPVQIESDQPIVAAERVIYKVGNRPASFTEMMALPQGQLSTTYWLPWYNNVDLDTQLRIGNVSGDTAVVHILIGGTEVTPPGGLSLASGASTRLSYTGVNNGPVQIVSSMNIVAAERVIYKANGVNTSFAEMMALSDGQLSIAYWLPWYNNVDLDTQLRFGVP